MFLEKTVLFLYQKAEHINTESTGISIFDKVIAGLHGRKYRWLKDCSKTREGHLINF